VFPVRYELGFYIPEDGILPGLNLRAVKICAGKYYGTRHTAQVFLSSSTYGMKPCPGLGLFWALLQYLIISSFGFQCEAKN
jgi:hypothetical protein